MEKRRLGRLEHMSTVLFYGGAALAEVTQDEADESIAFALDAGINHFDTAADYGDSELRLGPWMNDIRSRIFLSTKTGERSKDAATREIHSSLERLQVDKVDLIQLHAIGDLEELDKATGPGGSLEAAVEAKEQGLAGAIGITGHGHRAPSTHLEALRRHPFETVLTPLNYLLFSKDSYRRDYEALVEEIKRQDAALLIIKAISKGLWREGEEQRYATWYEPFDEQRYIDATIAFALARDEITGLAIAGDIHLLPQIVDAEKRASATAFAEIEDVMASVPDYASPFAPAPGRLGPL
ncbi:MAG: aldo/keto reductase [Actinobacteria bacterium]|nr:aldo/keto reductase [Actinomycetota bacterium]